MLGPPPAQYLLLREVWKAHCVRVGVSPSINGHWWAKAGAVLANVAQFFPAGVSARLQGVPPPWTSIGSALSRPGVIFSPDIEVRRTHDDGRGPASDGFKFNKRVGSECVAVTERALIVQPLTAFASVAAGCAVTAWAASKSKWFGLLAGSASAAAHLLCFGARLWHVREFTHHQALLQAMCDGPVPTDMSVASARCDSADAMVRPGVNYQSTEPMLTATTKTVALHIQSIRIRGTFNTESDTVDDPFKWGFAPAPITRWAAAHVCVILYGSFSTVLTLENFLSLLSLIRKWIPASVLFLRRALASGALSVVA